MKIVVKFVVFFLSFCAVGQANTAINTEQKNTNSLLVPTNQWFLGLAAGYGVIENPVYEQKDVPLYLLPDIRYYGEKLSIENLNVSYNLFENEQIVVDLIGQQNLDALYFPGNNRKLMGALSGNESNIRRPFMFFSNEKEPINVEHKSLSYLAGGELRYYGDILYRLSAAYDVSNLHHGFELKGMANKMWAVNAWKIELELGVIFKDKNLTDYYYGYQLPTPIEAMEDQRYHTSSALNVSAQLDVTYELSQQWYVVSAIKNEWLDRTIRNSPLIVKNSVSSYFVGIKHLF